LGSNGQYDPGTDVIGSKMAYSDTNGGYTVNLVNRNGNWDILINGSSVLNEADTNKINALNAEINALSTYGGTPIYTGGYDNLGSPNVDGNIVLTVKNINGRLIGNNVNWGKVSENPAPSNANGYSWTDVSGFGGISNTNLGINIQGSGRQALFNYFYADKINNFDGLNSTLTIDSVAMLNGTNHNSYIGLQFGSVKDNVLVFSDSAPGFMLVLQPSSTANIYSVSALVNNGSGLASATTTMTSITLGSGGGIAVKLYKDQASVWHLNLNGIDAGVDFSAIQSVLNQGGYPRNNYITKNLKPHTQHFHSYLC
jgi:hypothetical protein